MNIKVSRILADGRLDPSFGQGGVVSFPRRGRNSILPAVISVDRVGRILLAGDVAQVGRRRIALGSEPGFALARLDRSGHLDRAFGRNGTIGTEFDGDLSAEVWDLVVDDRHRALVAGVLTESSSEPQGSLALTRYELGR